MNEKSKTLRNILSSPAMEFMLEAHNALSAKLVEESGFKAIWASGLSISASMGVRDCNEASWTQVLDIIEFMSDATTVPILLDGDTGYGNFNNLRRLVRKLEQRGIAGVCIEDKLFPKTNSFIDGERQPLASIEEFTGKIKAGKDSQSSSDFNVIARVEAFIAGWGLDEALKRADAYRLAGADAVLIHSKRSDCHEIEMFMKEWGGRHPVIIVPTKYYTTPTERFRQMGISVVIWANQVLRASVNSIKNVARRIHDDESISNVEHNIAPISDIFELQKADELSQAEKVYLPRTSSDVKAIILAGNPGRSFGELTEEKPKCMIKVQGVPILYQLINQLNILNIKDITVIRGYRKEAIRAVNFKTMDNEDHENTKGLKSLYLAKEEISGDTLIVYGDSLFRSYLIEKLLSMESDFNIIVDADPKHDERVRDLVRCNHPYRNDFQKQEIHLTDIFISRKYEQCHGEWIGMLYVKARSAPKLKAAIERLGARSDANSLHLADILSELSKSEQIAVAYSKGGWLDVDIYKDLELAGSF